MLKKRFRKNILARKISKSLDMPFDGVSSSFRIEMHGDAEANQRMRKKLEYDHSLVKLRLKGAISIYAATRRNVLHILTERWKLKVLITDLKLWGILKIFFQSYFKQYFRLLQITSEQKMPKAF